MKDFEACVISYLLNSLWQVPLLLLGGWLASRAVRSISTAAEHRVWVAVLLLQSLVPAVSSFPSGWYQACLQWLHTSQNQPVSSVTIQIGQGVLAGTHPFSAAWLSALFLVYAILCAYFACRFAWRCAHLATIERHSVPVALSGENQLSWSGSLDLFNEQNVSLRSSSRIFAPLTIGAARKLIVLPDNLLAHMPQAELRTVLAHELAHIQRHDFLKNLCYNLLSLPVAYHPAVWFTHERVTESREMLCDQIAARFDGPMEYGRSLLKLAYLLVNGMPSRLPHAIGIFDTNTLERRIMQLKKKPTTTTPTRRYLISAACSAILLAACGSAVAFGLRADQAGAQQDSTARAAFLGQFTARRVSTEEPKAKSPQRVTVPAGEMQGQVLTKVTPKYPEEAKKQGIQGKVVLNAVINKSGEIENLKVESGPKELQQSALDAVRQWTYKPYLLNGEPVEVTTTINVTYSLAK